MEEEEKELDNAINSFSEIFNVNTLIYKQDKKWFDPDNIFTLERKEFFV